MNLFKQLCGTACCLLGLLALPATVSAAPAKKPAKTAAKPAEKKTDKKSDKADAKKDSKKAAKPAADKKSDKTPNAKGKAADKNKKNDQDTRKDKNQDKAKKAKDSAKDKARDAKNGKTKEKQPESAKTKEKERAKPAGKAQAKKPADDPLHSIISRKSKTIPTPAPQAESTHDTEAKPAETPKSSANNSPDHDELDRLIARKSDEAKKSRSAAVAAAPARKESAQENATEDKRPISKGDADELIRNAMGLIGVAYRFGGTSPSTGFDCSGFMQHIFRKAFAVNLPRTSAEQARVGTYVARSDLQPGDMVFFRTHGSRISHVGMYVGNNRFIHAPRTGKRIEIVSLSNKYWNARYATARRVKRNNADRFVR